MNASLFSRFFNYIRSKYIYRFLGIFLLLLSLSILAFSIASYKMSSSVIIKDYLNYKKEINRQIAVSMDENIKNLSRQSMASLMLNQDINYIITSSYTDDQYFDKIKTINTYFFSLLQSTPKVYAVTILDKNMNIKLYMDAKNTSNSKNNLGNNDWYKKTVSLDGQPYFIEPHVNDYVFKSYTYSKVTSVVSISRVIKTEIPDNSVLGIIIFDQLTDEFLKEIKAAKLETNETLALLGQKGEILYSNSHIDQNLQNFLITNMKGNRIDTFTYVQSGQKLLINLSKTSYDLTIASIIPYSTLNKRSNFIWDINTKLLFVVIILSFITFFIFSYFFSKPLKKLNSAIKKVKKGDFSTKVFIKGSHELSQVGSTFNDMVAHINDLIQQKYHANLLRKQAELEFLQSQINPHFLYNTLSSIMNVSEQGNREKTSQMLQNLSDIFRYSLSKGRYIVKFYEELLQVKKYLELQENRYAGIYKVIYDIAPDVMHYDILRFTLQPIVENAIYHGLEGVRGDGEICITARIFEDILNIYVSDSGKGIEPADLNSINSLLDNWDENISVVNSTKVGIYNVNSRIKLHFGKKYGIKISSKPGLSTTVKITHPAERSFKVT